MLNELKFALRSLFHRGLMLQILANLLVTSGACILIGALMPVHRLIVQLPAGQLRRRWFILSILIILFIAGYLAFALAFWSNQSSILDLIVPTIFFFGAVFVWLTASLSLQTAYDVRRLSSLEYENITDPLMGIYNRRYLYRRLEEECSRARRYMVPLSVIMIDIDHFKRINDTYGHQVGDLVLSELGKVLLQVIRDADIAARYGGEEILTILPNTTALEAGVLAERLRQVVEVHRLVLNNEANEKSDIHFTISLGVADLRHESVGYNEMIQLADKALYLAKQDGRNRVVIHKGASGG